MDEIQNLTEYEPTEKEKNLLEVLLNPENRMKSITDVCKLANCSRPIYYEAFAKPGFTKIYTDKSQDLVKQSIGPVINACVKEAQRGSFQHIQMLLEMAGIYQKSAKTDINLKGDMRTENYSVDLTKLTLDQVEQLYNAPKGELIAEYNKIISNNGNK